MKHFLIPQRLEGESFEAYKLRRALGNKYAYGTDAQREEIRRNMEINDWINKHYKKADASEV